MSTFRPRGVRPVAGLAVFLTVLVSTGCGGSSSSSNGAVPTATEPTTSAGAMPSGGMAGMHHGATMVGTTMKQVAQTTWQGMRIAAAFMSPPVAFTVWNGTRQVLVEPRRSQDVHFMVVLSDAQTGERIPYASVDATIADPKGKVVYTARQWPMLSRSMGLHYGNNVALPGPGRYSLTLLIGPPAVGRHPEYQKVWLVPHKVRLSFRWKGQV